MPTTLLDFATQERDLYKTARDNAQNRLNAANTSLSAARTQLSTSLGQLQQLEEQIAAKRAQLAVTTVPSNAAQLLEDLAALTIQHRQKQAQVLDAQATLGAAQAAVASAQSMLSLASSRLTDAEAKREKAVQEVGRREGLKTQVGQAPLVDLRTTAANVLSGAGGSTLYADAQAKFGSTIIPAKLWDLATQRYTLWSERLKLARKAVEAAEVQRANLLDANGGLAGKAESKGVTFRQAERRLNEYALTAQDRYTRAITLLTQISAPSNQVLTQAERDDIQLLLTDRNAAADLEKLLDAAQLALDPLQAAYDDAVLAAYAKDPNDTDISDDAGVVAKKAPRDTAEGTRNTARGNLGSTHRQTLREWAAVLPDSAWRQILAFLEATALLNELKDTLTTLVSDVTTAENDYAVALLAAVKHEYSLAFLENAIATRKAMLESVQANQPNRLLSAIRGDDI